MTKLHIVIPSRGRAEWDRQTTLQQLMRAAVPVTLVVPKEEVRAYRAMLLTGGRGLGLVKVRGCPRDGIGKVRWYITRVMYRTGRVLMLDDDLEIQRMDHQFAEPINFVIWDLIRTMHALLDAMPLVMMVTDTGIYSGVYGCDTAAMRKWRVRFGRIPVCEGIDVRLWAIRRGMPTGVLADFVCIESRKRKGGCTAYRTAEFEREAIKRLARVHPHLVKIITLSPKPKIEVAYTCNVKSLSTPKSGTDLGVTAKSLA